MVKLKNLFDICERVCYNIQRMGCYKIFSWRPSCLHFPLFLNTGVTMYNSTKYPGTINIWTEISNIFKVSYSSKVSHATNKLTPEYKDLNEAQ